MQVEESMIHRFQRQRKSNLPIGGAASGILIALHFASDLCKARHRAYGCRDFLLSFLRCAFQDPATALGASILANCNS